MKTLSEIVAAKTRKDYSRALKEAVTLIKKDSKNPGLYILIGSLLDQREEWTGMAGAFSAAIQLDRDFAFSHGELSLACYKMQQSCARTEAETMLAIQPRSSDAHKYLGLAYEMVGELQLALVEYQTALSLGSRAPELIYFDIGRAKVLGHDLNGAISPFRRSIEVNPTFWRGFAALGDTYVDLGNIDQGLINLRKAKAIAPDRLEIRQNIGAALCDSGRYMEAIPEFEDLLQLDPNWNMARFCLAKSLRAVGRLDEANKVLEEYKRQEALQ